MENTLITFENVSKRLDGRPALDGFSLSVRAGEFLTVIGRSGCGKTTMLKMINGLQRPDAGRVLFQGRDLAGQDMIRLRRSMGYVIQGGGLFPHMDVCQNIAYVPDLVGGVSQRQCQTLARQLLRLVGLDEDTARRYPSELSAGQQQRVGIARALAASPQLLLMDEPFSALDEITRTMLQNEMLCIHARLGLTVIFISRDSREACRLGDRVLVMRDGKAAQIGRPDDICGAPADDHVKQLICLGGLSSGPAAGGKSPQTAFV